MTTIKVQFVVKAEVKVVTVDFYSDSYDFTNHLKRCVLTQIKGSVQKNTILNLVNEKSFTVLEDEAVIYQGNKETTPTSTFNPLTNVNTINIERSSSYLGELSSEGGLEVIDKICYRIDEIQEESNSLYTMLQKLVLKEQELVNNKIAALR